MDGRRIPLSPKQLAHARYKIKKIHFGIYEREKDAPRRRANKRAERVNVEAICRPLAAAADYFFGIAIK